MQVVKKVTLRVTGCYARMRGMINIRTIIVKYYFIETDLQVSDARVSTCMCTGRTKYFAVQNIFFCHFSNLNSKF